MLLDKVFPPDIRVDKEARTLLSAGHQVFLLSRRINDLPSEELIDGTRVVRKNESRKLPKKAWDFFQFLAFFVHPFWENALREAAIRCQAEAIHVHDLPLVKTGLSIARKLSIPLIADLHENYPEAIKAYPPSWKAKLIKPIMLKRWKQVEKTSVRQADRIISVVDEARQHYVSNCGIPAEKVTVVMNTEDLDYFYSLPIQEEIIKQYEPYFTISYIGGFGRHRGIETAISAMPEILSEIRNARLILVGSGVNEKELRELARKKGMDDAVEFTGWQPFNLVPSYIVTSKVCLIPHIASGHTNSTIPHKLFQYLAMGKPVVVSSAKPLARIVQETGAGLVYPSGDAGALARAVISIYQDKKLAARFGDAGRRAVKEKYNWSMEGEKLVNLYRDLEKSSK